MKKPIIAVDIDEVLLPHFQDLVDWYNHEYGTSLKFADNQKGELTAWGVSDRETAIRRVHKFFDTPIFKGQKPFDEAVAAIELLSKDFELVVITARDTMLEEMTREWLATHFPEFFRAAHFTPKYNLEGRNRSKAEVALELKADYLIDDDVKNCTGVAEHGIKALLFGEYPWNEHVESPAGVTRVKDWAAVLEYFDGI